MHNKQEITTIIGNVQHFKHLNAEALQDLIDAGELVTATAATTLFWESEPCAGLYVLIEGQVHLKKIGPDGQVSILAILEPPFIFNEVPVFDNGSNPVTAVVSQDALLWHIQPAPFLELLKKYPQISLSLMYTLASHNRIVVDTPRTYN